MYRTLTCGEVDEKNVGEINFNLFGCRGMQCYASAIFV